MTNHDSDEPVGFLGKLRNRKVITWLLIVGLVAISVGAGTFLFIVQAANASR